MGQMLSEPITEKHTTNGANGRLTFGASAMQGWRTSMEDAHTTVLDFEGKKDTSFFAVFDGHGGSSAARFAGRTTHFRVVNDKEFEQKNYAAALKNGFLGTDIDLRKDPGYSREPSGCTAVAVLITEDNRVLCANAGDSRCIMSANGVAIPLSYDHKPNNASEFDRITKAGGFVQFGRVNGNLALSRAFGDFEFKQNATLRPEDQVVTANPDIIERDLQPNDEFIVLACDGIWDCMSNQQVVNFVRVRIAAGVPLGQICEELMMNCLARSSHALGVGCDNMSVIIVGLLMNKPYEHLVEMCKTPSQAPSDDKSENNGANASDAADGSPAGASIAQQTSMFQVYAAQFHSELEEFSDSMQYDEEDDDARNDFKQSDGD